MMESAVQREKQLKKWSRIAKIRLIEQRNPDWHDLWTELISPSMAPGSRHKSVWNRFALTRRATGRIACRESLPG